MGSGIQKVFAELQAGKVVYDSEFYKAAFFDLIEAVDEIRDRLCRIEAKLPDRSREDQPGVDANKWISELREKLEKAFTPPNQD